MSTALLRAKQALHAAGLLDAGPLRRVDAANEVWVAGSYVLRVSPTAGTRRLAHEAAVASLLPAAVRHPGVIAQGEAAFGEWMVVRRLPGTTLSRSWVEMSERERRDAILQLGGLLQALHRVPVDGHEALLDPPFLQPGSLECPHQLPLTRTLANIERARALPLVDGALMDEVEALARRLGASVSDDEEVVLIHGDLHFENVLYAHGQITGLLDFEFARAAAADVDLEVMLRFCAAPQLTVSSDYAHLAKREDYRKVLSWMREGYPALFAHPALHDRLNFYSLTYDVRDLLLDPPRRPEPDLPPFHPLRRLRRLLDGRGVLQLIDW